MTPSQASFMQAAFRGLPFFCALPPFRGKFCRELRLHGYSSRLVEISLAILLVYNKIMLEALSRPVAMAYGARGGRFAMQNGLFQAPKRAVPQCRTARSAGGVSKAPGRESPPVAGARSEGASSRVCAHGRKPCFACIKIHFRCVVCIILHII